ncbi:hypothetical protein SDC9_137975 [bioreactor metagenome]|uniref:Uncharacterized protein n=1 Tax=bioreactor metagenome TaxID=1076179 RepID=A0A645DQU4_9ZZZZ
MCLFELVLNQRNRKSRSIDRNIELLECIGQRANVILMSMRDEKAFELVAVLTQVCHIRNDNVDAGHIVIRKAKPAVDNDDIAVVFKYGHILPDFTHAAERDNF